MRLKEQDYQKTKKEKYCNVIKNAKQFFKKLFNIAK